MSNSIDIQKFLELAAHRTVFDVRTPEEFEKGHFPGAHNLPLFSNEERGVIGTLYKQSGRDPAVLKGLEFVGPRMRKIVESVKPFCGGQGILVHCWRGGMRSQSVAWLLQTSGIATSVLEGGYKVYRHFVLQTFEEKRRVIIVSGTTGSGKTDILHALKKRGEQIIDLEGLANHKGSSFGALGEAPQPTQQQFENELAQAWYGLDPLRPVWIEDESRHVGACGIPLAIWQQMRQARVALLDMPASLRVDRLMKDYGEFGIPDLLAATQRLQKRLGGLHTRQTLSLIEAGDIAAAIRLLLDQYYDKSYRHGLSKRDELSLVGIPTGVADADANADLLLNHLEQLLQK